MSMCALAVIAWKCNVPVDKVEQDLLSLIPTYNEGATRQIKEKEIKHALRMYNEKAIITPRQRLEDWIGWEYHPIKRNGRKQNLHLRMARSNLSILNEETGMSLQGRPKGSTDKKPRRSCCQIVQDYRSQHPEASPADCITDTRLSKSTVYRWWKEAKTDEK